MNNKKSKILVTVLSVVLGISLLAVLYVAATAVSENSFILISKDYLDKNLLPTINLKNGEQDAALKELEAKYELLLKQYETLNESYNKLLSGTAPDSSLSGAGFVAVKIDAGKALYPAGENARCLEVILQRGSAFVVFPIETQGILDASEGKELMNGAVVPQGHYLIVPHANDGRAIAAVDVDAWVLVRGEYTVE